MARIRETRETQIALSWIARDEALFCRLGSTVCEGPEGLDPDVAALTPTVSVIVGCDPEPEYSVS